MTPAPAPSLAPVALQAPVWPVRLLGIALAVASCDPALPADLSVAGVLRPAAAAALAWWAAPAVTRRPVQYSARKTALLSAHRNTVFAVSCVVLAAFSTPPPWLACCVSALLLTYLLIADACAAGPAGVRQLRARHVPAAAYGASALVLLAAFAPAGSGAWGPAVAAGALCMSAYAVGLSLWPRRSRAPRSSSRSSARRSAASSSHSRVERPEEQQLPHRSPPVPK
ncbi:hypothetical protein QMK19_11180 [Streptomyces sp. H10-C2]|uniref:hypothetical protein n=1 Tax=unclassified Streptomyces TaxID=2593676 RepID=UPI0024BB8124|nr:MULTISPECIES: hypothetical protein [unclassified Streptomyces]MDJ0340573.1 hypothetical protein [Streptomyces sp. PH10-H1]MDJ0370221.1 hypothetical protein [Streptomyces sp. H10-C2]